MSGATVRRTTHHPTAGEYGRLGAAARRSMPGRAPQPRITRFWYVPVAALLAVLVAAGVIFAGDRLFLGGDDDEDAPPADASAVPSETTPGAAPSATEPPAAGAGTPGTAAAGATPGGPLAAGGTAVVAETGGCLNVRSEATLSGAIVTCVADGTTVNIIEGPVEADGFQWYHVSTDAGEGWAADDYLQPGG
jgi:hypothetical protein